MTSPSDHVSLEILRALLQHFAWSRSTSPGDAYELWSRAGGFREGEVIVPLDAQRGDYDALLGRATRVLMQHHGAAAERLASELKIRRSGLLDSTRWEKETFAPTGLILWDEGQALFDSARMQLVAAAKAVRDRRAYHGNASSYVAKRFLEQSYMGQTDVGSYVVTALTPAQTRIHLTRRSEELALQDPREVEAVSGRAILQTLSTALSAVRDGLDEYTRRPSVEVFVERVEAGVSHELVKALAALAEHGESAIHIEMGALEEVTGTTVEFGFRPPEATVLQLVSNLLAQDPEPRAVTLVGEVTLLSRDYGQSQRVIRLDMAQGSQVRKARVRLSSEQYELALRAHREERAIQVSGSLEKEGRLFWLYDAHDMRVLDEVTAAWHRKEVAGMDVPLDFGEP